MDVGTSEKATHISIHQSHEENIAEYEALRGEILRLQDCVRNETMWMYTVYTALFTLGFNYNILFIGSFIVLIVFQAMIIT